MSNPIRDRLNRHKWQLRDLDHVTLIVRHRGAPDDLAYIGGSQIAEIRPDGIVLSAPADGEASFIPYHRILDVTRSK